MPKKTILQPGTHTFEITTPGEHVFYASNLSGNFTFMITAPHAHLRLYGIFHDHISYDHEIFISVLHNAPHTKSDVTIKSILDHGAQLHFTGLIHVAPRATHTEATMYNHNLILDRTSHVISIPQLEVRPSLATCTHRSVTTPPNPSLITYLGTRGITPVHAKELLINGFLSDMPHHNTTTNA